MITFRSVHADGYALTVTDTAVSLRASNLRGFIYGAESLCKLLTDGRLPVCDILDHPRMPWRGAHLMIPSEENIPFFNLNAI